MSSAKIKDYRSCALVLEVIKSPEVSPYALSLALHDKGIDMVPQTIYNYLEYFGIKNVSKRKKLRKRFLERFNVE